VLDNGFSTHYLPYIHGEVSVVVSKSVLRRMAIQDRDRAISRREAEAVVSGADRGEISCPCRHGHLECSIVTVGPCLDEALAVFPELGGK
jgi:hypothetical protein